MLKDIKNIKTISVTNAKKVEFSLQTTLKLF